MRKLKRNLSGIVIMLLAPGVCWTAAIAGPATHHGESVAMGNGSVNTYVTLLDDRTPLAIGIRFTETALSGLPERPNNTNRCFDRNGDGRLEAGVECLGEYEFIMRFPDEAEAADLPFEWLELDWNAHGHGPPHVYDKPHFDVHFYMVDPQYVQAIRPGACGVMIDCEDFERASRPVPARHLPAGYVDKGAAVARMGNHLLNSASPELADPPKPFSHTFIYGAYDGRITFMEPMMTHGFLLDRPDMCASVAQPAQWPNPGNYPSTYCIRYLPEESAYTISLEGFVRHDPAAASRSPSSYPETS